MPRVSFSQVPSGPAALPLLGQASGVYRGPVVLALVLKKPPEFVVGGRGRGGHSKVSKWLSIPFIGVVAPHPSLSLTLYIS